MYWPYDLFDSMIIVFLLIVTLGASYGYSRGYAIINKWLFFFCLVLGALVVGQVARECAHYRLWVGIAAGVFVPAATVTWGMYRAYVEEQEFERRMGWEK